MTGTETTDRPLGHCGSWALDGEPIEDAGWIHDVYVCGAA